MNIFRSHISEALDHFIKVQDNQFETIFERVKNPSKKPLRDLLVYVHNLMDSLLHNSSLSLSYHHIHFPEFILDSDVILEFLCIKFFLSNLVKDCECQVFTEDYYESHSARIANFLRAPLTLAVGEGKRVERRNKEKRKQLRYLLKELNNLKEITLNKKNGLVKPKCLFNVSLAAMESIYSSDTSTPYFVSVDYLLKGDLCKPLSYVLLNNDKSLSDLDMIKIRDQNEFLEDIRDVVIFDSEGKGNNYQYNFSKLADFNECGTNFKNLIIVSFDRRPLRLNRLISQHAKIANRYYERLSSLTPKAYTVLPYESQKLGQRKVQGDILVEFVNGNSSFWTILLNKIYQYENLSELVSIKMRNVYSLCYTERYKSIVMDDIFSNNTSNSYLLTPETKERMSDLNYREREEIKTMISDILDFIMSLNIPSSIVQNNYDQASTFVLPFLIVSHSQLLEEVKSAFGNSSKLITTTWKSIGNTDKNNVIILEYRDPGRSPYLIYPNLLENSINANLIKAYLVKCFFETNYEYAYFDYNKTLYRKILANETRTNYFKWGELSRKIEALKPDNSAITELLDLDDDYTGQGEKESIVIKFKLGNKKAFHPSQLFVVRDMEEDQLFSIKADDLIDQFEESPRKTVFAQPLDELYQGLNLFQTTIEEEKEVYQLKKSFNINEREIEQRIWKILLKRKSEKSGISDIYHQLKEYLGEKGLPMVKEDYFANYWLEISSEMLIPRSKKVFQVICNFLKLPEVYLIVMLKKRARERLATRKSTNKMNQLIAALVDRGLFDKNPAIAMLDSTFLSKYELEEIGINESNLSREIISLVGLLKPNINLKEIRTLERKKI